MREQSGSPLPDQSIRPAVSQGGEGGQAEGPGGGRDSRTKVAFMQGTGLQPDGRREAGSCLESPPSPTLGSSLPRPVGTTGDIEMGGPQGG